MGEPAKKLLEVVDLKEYFDINVGAFKTKPLKAVDGVSFYVNKGETLGLRQNDCRQNYSQPL